MMFFVIDLEATCWETSNVPDRNEIIEIGLVACDGKNDLETYQAFVKPKINPVLSAFCKNLTKIEQRWIDAAEGLPAVVEDMKEWSKKTFGQPIDQVPWTSWGDFDRNCLMKDCTRNGIEYYMGKHCSAKTLYANYRRCKKMGVDAAIRRERLPFKGTHHRALDDAINIASIIRKVNLAQTIMDSAQIWPLALPQ